MYKKIVNEVASLAEPDFAQWIKPFLSIKENSQETVLGVRVPKLRKLAKQYKDVGIDVLLKLLISNIHEHRALALFIMLHKTLKEPELMCKIYLENLSYINNWDLIDYTAPHIVAPNITSETFYALANSDYMWANRVAMVGTIYFIKQNDFEIALNLSEKFMHHPHHLMHKAAGWMLREIGKKDVRVLLDFLHKHEHEMPSVMKSYAKEKLKKY